MNLTDFFADEADLVQMLVLVRDRVMPILEWIDAHEDPDRKVKAQTALFILLTFRAVNEHGLRKDVAVRIVSNLIDAINEGTFDGAMTHH